MGWSHGPELPEEFRHDAAGEVRRQAAADAGSVDAEADAAEAPPTEGRRRATRGTIILVGIVVWFIISTLVSMIGRL